MKQHTETMPDGYTTSPTFPRSQFLCVMAQRHGVIGSVYKDRRAGDLFCAEIRRKDGVKHSGRYLRLGYYNTEAEAVTAAANYHAKNGLANDDAIDATMARAA